MAWERKVNVRSVIKMRNAGATLQQIADAQKVSKPAIHYVLKDIASMILPDEQLQEYRSKQADVLDSISATYASHMLNEAVIKETKSRDAGVIVGIAIDKSRLIQGQSTSNASVMLRYIQSACQQETTPIDDV